MIIDTGSADSVVVIVKLVAVEGVVTYLRVKLPVNTREDGEVKGRTC